jgi:TPR repeat protein
MKYSRWIALLLLVVFSSGHCFAEDKNAALLQKADKGEILAQYTLYENYSRGDGIRRDNEIASNWLLKIVGSDNCLSYYCVEALVQLGGLYEEGRGVKQDYGEAASLSKLSG